MASREALGGPRVCLVCLETHEVLKVVPTCKHVFCKKCLSTHLQTLVEAKGSFPCPTCQVDSPIEGNDVDALLDCNGVDEVGALRVAVATETEILAVRPKVSLAGTADDQGKNKEKATCKICHFTKKSDVSAENVCEHCGNLYLCKECTRLHAENKETEDHVVISLQSKRKKAEGRCKAHEEPINSYCDTCSKPSCQVCKLTDHAGHSIKKFGEAFRSMVADVKAAKEKQEGRSAALASIEDDLTFMKLFNIDSQGILIQQIEEYAEKCIDKIVKDKEALKNQVRDNFKMTKDISECLDKVPALAKTVDKSIVKATRLLSEAEPNPMDLERHALVRDDMMMSGKLVDERDKNCSWEAFEKLWSNAPRFVPNTDNHSFGTLSVVPAVLNLKSAKFKLVFEKILEVDNESKFIPCVTNLGNDLYAVAHPAIQGQQSDALDIYRFPGEFKQTIRDHVLPFYDMAATPFGKLAVLSNGATEGTCSVRLFDPGTGFIRSTKDFPICHPLSFDVNLRNQYVILNNDGRRRITIFNEDGSLEVTHLIDEVNDVKDASRIACSARCIYVNGFVGQKGAFACYEQKGKQLLKVTVFNESSFNYKDISAGQFVGIAECFKYAKNIYIRMHVLGNNQLKYHSGITVGEVPNKPDIECRLSIRDNDYIVSSWGHTIKIFKALTTSPQ